MFTKFTRARWAAAGAAIAVTLGAGGLGLVDAAKGTGERAVYTAIEPCRLVDTRPEHAVGDRTTPLGPTEVFSITALGDNGECTDIPDDAVALELNVTGLLNTGATHFTVWNGVGDAPNASHVNLAPNAPATPNSVTTEVAGSGFAIRNNSATAHVIVDIVGIYQDHHHDDRYYTETEIDAMNNPSSILIGPSDLRGGGAWSSGESGVSRSSGGVATCAHAPISIPSGRVISSFDIRYEAGPVAVEILVQQDKFEEGFTGSDEFIRTGSQTLTGVGSNEFYTAVENLPVTGSGTVSAAFDLQQLKICSSATIYVNSVRINFAD